MMMIKTQMITITRTTTGTLTGAMLSPSSSSFSFSPWWWICLWVSCTGQPTLSVDKCKVDRKLKTEKKVCALNCSAHWINMQMWLPHLGHEWVCHCQWAAGTVVGRRSESHSDTYLYQWHSVQKASPLQCHVWSQQCTAPEAYRKLVFLNVQCKSFSFISYNPHVFRVMCSFMLFLRESRKQLDRSYYIAKNR